MKKASLLCVAWFILTMFSLPQAFSQEQETPLLSEKTFSGLHFRSIGPAFMSGRIADVAIHPENKHIWYVAVGSGGVWKTENSGNSWKPVFDDQSSYSIGCVTIDPGNSHIVWVGTGENVGGRHVGFGDGVYRSMDDGAHWEHMGLKASQHISKIVVHPDNSDIVWVAAQGPLWNKGDERGLYKTTDGGKTWKKTLGDADWVGVTDVVMDPRTPDRLYAATWQRHRNVAAYMGGGPGTAIYRSEDGGESWIKLSEGLPTANMGKIGLALSPQQPDVIYAAIELERRTGAIYKSLNRGASWTKESETVSGATGPHYYQELYASPHQFDRLYLVDFRIQVSDDGGKKFRWLKEENKHSDNHVIAFRSDEPDYLLVGCDGGLYESVDLAETWRFVANLPVTQFYKVAVDDAMPFYNIYGGTQDNGTQSGPVRTDNKQGITNEDWEIVLFADGHQPATEPGNPDIIYAEWQEGNLVRIDRSTGEIVGIKPQPEAGEDYERFNWDAPILVSPHSPTRIYYASQRVWRSDDRGDSWKPISANLTEDQEIMSLPIMDKTWSWDAPWDVWAMSDYNTISSLAESPLQEGLIYAGTDDGFIHMTEDGGEQWNSIKVANMPGVPATAFVNDIKADLFDVNTLYVALDNHKFGDFTPYLMKSTNRGKTWKSIRGNLPEKTLVWRFVQDHIQSGLCFIATEFGLYFTIDGGANWIKFTGSLPTISFRDLAIQRRENDLIGASFGRSFYVLDDYSMLRDITEEGLKQEAVLFGTRDAWWYIPRMGKHGQGASFFVADNPDFGATFTYYLSESYQTLNEKRKEKEKTLAKKNESISFPGWDAIEQERVQEEPKIWLTIRDADGYIVRKLSGPATKGFHRVSWNLRYPSPYVIDASSDLKLEDNRGGGVGMVPPGTYTVSLSKEMDGKISILSDTGSFQVVPLRKGSLEGSCLDGVSAFWREVNQLIGALSVYDSKIKDDLAKLRAMKLSLARSEIAPEEMEAKLQIIKDELLALGRRMHGDPSKNQIGVRNTPTVYARLQAAESGVANSTYGPTPTHIRSLEMAVAELEALKAAIDLITDTKIPELEKVLQDYGAPVIK